MSGDKTYPATVGQLSVWRDIEKIPPDRRWEANLAFVWNLPETGEPIAEERIWQALGRLGMRHGSLRTTYTVDDDGFPRQRLLGDGGADPDGTEAEILRQVRQGTADVAELAELEPRVQQRNVDVLSELPWRAWILTDAGRPVRVLIIVNHMAADGAGGLVMEEDFLRLLGGEDLPPAPGPLEMALDQQGEGSARLRNAERYWRRTLAGAPRPVETDVAQERVGATLHTGIPMPQAHEGAAKAGVSLASLLLTVYHRAVCSVTGERAHLMFPMSNNRYDERAARVVTSLNQWVPLVLDVDPAEPFEQAAAKVHWKSFNALKNGVCSPDAILQIRAEHADADPGYYYNPILAPPGFPSNDLPVPSTVEWYEPARKTGPGFYLIGRGLSSLDLVLRVYRPGWDRPRVEAFVNNVQAELEATIGA